MLLLCLGYGYSARELAALAAAHGAPTLGTSRDGRGGTLLYDGGEISPALASAIGQASHILISVPPYASEAALAHAIREGAGQCRWLGYLSTSGVYGDHQGRRVDESTPVAPMDAQGEARVQSERIWRRQGAHLFRLAGIYGPGRSVFDSIAKGQAQRIIKPGHRFNRIHVADIARALWASMQAPTPYAVYNLADDLPAAQAEVTAYACRLLGRPTPAPVPFEAARLSPAAARFWAASRQVDSSKIKRYHGLNWKYPTFRHGLAAILQEGVQRP